MGSDEVYAVFSDLDPTHNDRTTSTFGDFDAGETRDFPADQSCIVAQPACDRGVADVHFRLSLWEHDGSLFPFPHGQVTGGHNILEGGVNTEDDIIGKAEVTKTRDELLAALPTVGSFADFTITPTGGDGHYELTYRITRLANRFNVPPIGPTEPVVVAGISLQVTAAGSGNVTLTWSGATANSVDIYRDGSKKATAPNNGTYSDHTTPGSHSYHLCNAGTTTCSADVGVVVT
jgi:hypothetical protein